jgi:hypothetical protein
MKRKKKYLTLGDYVTMAFSPVLIITLVGSLVFFLAEVFYAGQYSGRLLWTLFWFVMGMVLIARIQIEGGSVRWRFYGFALGIVVYLSLNAFIEYPAESALSAFRWLINLVLIGVIWGATHRLTWDSTYIDDRVDASGMGVLEAAGLDEAAASPEGLTKTVDEPPTAQPTDATDRPKNSSWWARYRTYRNEQAQKPHTPGVWIVYFSLAALPLFGLGQALIPVGETERRQYLFWLFTLYVGSGLGLLLTTSYLGLRRYLRQRKLGMPKAMTGVWLTVGGSMVIVLLVLGAILPRPFGEYQLFEFTPFGSTERQASQFALKDDAKAKGEGRGSSDSSQKDPDAKSGDGAQSDKKAQSDKSGSSGRGKASNTGDARGINDSKSSDSQNSSDSKERWDTAKDQKRDDRQRDESRDGERKKDGEGAEAKKDSGRGRSTASRSTSRSPQVTNTTGILNKFEWVAKPLKWIVFGIVALIVGFYVLRNGLRFLANFTHWAKRLLEALRVFWQSLFGGWQRSAAAESESNPEERIERPRPFSFFHDPFLTGSAQSMSANAVVCYTFEALQSWAWERKLGRTPAETPREFVERVIGEVPGLQRDARGLAGLYARVAYARSKLGPKSLDVVRDFWSRLHEVTERPLSA